MAGIILKMKVKKISIMPTGFSIEFALTYNLKIDMIKAIMVIYTNFLIMLFNLLPIYPLDGGRILKSIICLNKKRKCAILYTNKISNMTLFFISFLFSILIYYYKNWAIIVILMYLWYIVLKENRICRMKLKLYENLEKL